MTLSEWQWKTRVHITNHGDARVIVYVYNIPMTWELWHLDDYLVSSVTGGAIWLIPRVRDII